MPGFKFLDMLGSLYTCNKRIKKEALLFKTKISM